MDPYSSFSSVSSYTPSRKFKGGAGEADGAIIGISVVIIFLLFMSILLTVAWGAPADNSTELGSRLAKAKQSVKDAFSRVGGGKVKELKSSKEVRDKLSGSTPAMVFVYMKGCGFCQKAAPIFDALAADNTDVTFYKIDSAVAKELLAAEQIQGFPTWLTTAGSGGAKKSMGLKAQKEMQNIVDAIKPAATGSLRRSKKHAKGARIVVSPVHASASSSAGVAREVNAAEARTLLAGKAPAVVFVGQSWCTYCKKMKPIIDEIALMFPNIQLVKLDGKGKDAENFIADTGITGFPSLLRNFGPSKMVVGYKDKNNLIKVLKGLE